MPISSYLKSVREKVGHDLLTMTAVSLKASSTAKMVILHFLIEITSNGPSSNVAEIAIS
jgi:hypothetical protein